MIGNNNDVLQVWRGTKTLDTAFRINSIAHTICILCKFKAAAMAQWLRWWTHIKRTKIQVKMFYDPSTLHARNRSTWTTQCMMLKSILLNLHYAAMFFNKHNHFTNHCLCLAQLTNCPSKYCSPNFCLQTRCQCQYLEDEIAADSITQSN